METLLLVICGLLIVVVLLQSSKASDAGQIITGGNAMLFGVIKERGSDKFLTRITYLLGFLFILLSMILSI